MTNLVILGGGNSGDVIQNLNRAEEFISQRIGQIIDSSERLITEPWGFEGRLNFINQAWVVATTLPATEAMEQLLEIEALIGRDRKREYIEKMTGGQRYADRVIDLDILIYGEQVVVTPHLQIPHPRLLERDFALIPMSQALKCDVESCKLLVRKIVENEI